MVAAQYRKTTLSEHNYLPHTVLFSAYRFNKQIRYMSKRALALCLSMVFLLQLSAQDIHYSQFFNSPLNLNPALTGVYNGDARVHANFKNQWNSVPVGYNSADLGVDLKKRVGKKANYLGYGVLLNYDTAGDLNLGWTGANAFLAFGIKINDHSYLSPGVTVGYYQRAFDQSLATTGSQWNGKVISAGTPPEALANASINFLDVGVGLNYRWQKNYRKHIDLGGSLLHLNTPSQTFSDNQNFEVKRPQRLSFYGIVNYKIHDDVDLVVNGLYSTQATYEEIVVNVQGKIYLGGNKDKALFLGAGYRFNDAWYPMIAIQVGQFYGGFSYDLNISNFDIATGGRGGPELALRYIWARVPETAYEPCLIF